MKLESFKGYEVQNPLVNYPSQADQVPSCYVIIHELIQLSDLKVTDEGLNKLSDFHPESVYASVRVEL